MKIYLKNLCNDATVEWRGGGGRGEWGEDREKDSEKNSENFVKMEPRNPISHRLTSLLFLSFSITKSVF